MKMCELCPRKCKVERRDAKSLGFCMAGTEMQIAKYGLFLLEEPCISGGRGSGAIFFSGCSLRCVYCQNYEISSKMVGKVISPIELAAIFKELEDLGAENINLESPTHFADGIVAALEIYSPKIPIVYNCHGYETIEAVERLAKFVDVFLPDLKYFSSFSSERYSNAKNYFEVASAAILKMLELKPLVLENGLIKSGVIVRHLVLPLHVHDSELVLKWAEKNVKGRGLFSLMSQFTPIKNLENFPEINRTITKREYDIVKNKFVETGLEGFVQELSSANKNYIPKWDLI
ncbi:MAG: radical SAM protein [Clostridia bacterium]